MADATTTLSVTITGDASSALTMSDQMTAALQKIVEQEAALIGVASDSAAALEKLAESQGEASVAAEEHAEAESLLGASLGKVEIATNAAARSFGALGFATGEASERIFAFTEALDAIGEAAGPLLVLGAAFLAVGASINFIKDGIEEAEKSQVLMASIGQAIRNSGGDWDKARDGVDDFLDSIERATTYSRGEALEAINSLVTAGISLADSEKIVAISTDVAAGSHRSLIDVVDSVKQAELGRGRSLAETDIVLKALIKSHGDLSQALSDLSSKYRGEASAALDTAQGKSEALHNELNHFAEDLGEGLLPEIEMTTTVLIGLAEEAEKHEPQILHFFNTLINSAVTAARVIGDSASSIKLAYDVMGGDVEGILRDSQSGGPEDLLRAATSWDPTKASSPTGNWRQYTAEQIRTMQQQQEPMTPDMRVGGWYLAPGSPATGSAAPSTQSDQDWLTKFWDQATKRAQQYREEAEKALEATRNQPLQHDAQLGGPKTAGGEGPDAISPIDDDSEAKVSAYVEVQKQLDAALKNIVDSEHVYTEAVKLATDQTSADNAEMALHAKVAEDAQKAVGLLSGQIAYEQNELTRLTAEHEDANATMTAAHDKYNAYAESLGEGTKRTLAEKDQLAALKTEHDEAKKTFDATKTAIDGITSSLESNASKLAEAKDKTNALAEATAALDLAYANNLQKNAQADANEAATRGKSLEAQAAYWNAKAQIDAAAYVNGELSYKQFLEREEADQDNHNKAMLKIGDDAAELAKKKADLDQSLIDEEATYGKSLQQTLAYYQARYALLIAGDSNQRAEAEKYAQDIEKTEASMYEQRFDALKSFISDEQNVETTFLNDIIQKHEALKDALKDVFQSIEDDFTKMVEKMLVEQPLLNGLNKELASLFGGNATGPGGFSTAGGIAGGGGSSSLPLGATASYGTFGALFGTAGAQSIIGQIPTDGGLLSVLTGDNAIGEPTIALGGGSTATSGLASSLGMGTKDTTGGAQQTILGEVATGAGLGSALGGVGGDETTSAIGGAVGSVIGSVIGKLGGAAGGPLGSAIGSLVGGLIGGFFGPNYGPPSNYPDRSQPGYGQWLVDYQGAPATVNGQNVNPDPQYWEALGGTSLEASIGSWVTANASNSNLPQPLEALLKQFEALGGTDPGRDLGIKSEYNGIDTLWSGAQIPVTQLEQLTTEFQDLIGNTGAAVYDITAAYPNYSGTGNPAGYWQNGKWISGGPATGPGSTGTVVSTSATGSATTPTGGTVNVTINGNVVGPGGLQSIAGEIATAIARFENGEISGSSANNGITPAVVGN